MEIEGAAAYYAVVDKDKIFVQRQFKIYCRLHCKVVSRRLSFNIFTVCCRNIDALLSFCPKTNN